MGAFNCCEILKERDATGRTPLRVAIDYDQREITRALLENHGARTAIDVNARDDRGWTAMASACAFIKNEGILNLLVDAGADLNWKDHDG